MKLVFFVGDSKVKLRVVRIGVVAQVLFANDFEERADVDVEYW